MARKPSVTDRQLSLGKSEDGLNDLPIEPERLDGLPSEALKKADGRVLRPVLEESSGSAAQHEPVQELFIPVHGFITLSRSELAVLDHPALQRLGEIYQLGQSHLVFRGATHRRLEHCLGTLHIASRMADAVAANHKLASRSHSNHGLSAPLSATERAFVRLAALTHDVGHLAAGHTLEDELGLLDRHDYSERINHILDRSDWKGCDGRSLRSVIDAHYGPLLTERADYTASALILGLIAKDPPQRVSDDDVRVDVCRDIVGNTICADLLDYLHRDWYHVGKPKYFDDRILQYLEIRHNDDGRPVFVVSLGEQPKLRSDAISAILDLLESRYQLGETVLFHRTKLAFASMLERGVQELQSTKPDLLKKGLDELLEKTDVGVIDYLIHEAESAKSEGALAPLSALRQRRVYAGLFTRFSEEYPADVVERIKTLYSPPAASGLTKAEQQERARTSASNRLTSLRTLESDFGLAPGSLAMYCPHAMNVKIAKVKVAVGGQIHPLNRWEDKPSNLTGGHLRAQLHRFERLWRVHIFADRKIVEKMSQAKFRLLKDTIKALVFPKNATPSALATAALDLARRATAIEDMPQFQKRPLEAAPFAAKSTAGYVYPTGAARLTHCVE